MFRNLLTYHTPVSHYVCLRSSGTLVFAVFLINGVRVLVSSALVLVATSSTFILQHILKWNWVSSTRIRLLREYDVSAFA